MTSHPAHPLFAFIRRCGSVRITLSKSPVARVVPLVRSPTSPPPSPASASGSPVARVVPLPLLGVGLAHVGVLAVAGAVTEVVTAVLTTSVPAPGHAAAEWEGGGVRVRKSISAVLTPIVLAPGRAAAVEWEGRGVIRVSIRGEE